MKKIFATFFLATLLFVGFAVPQKAEAQLAVAEVGANLVTNTVTTAKAIENTVREYVLDGIAWELANVALEQMTEDIVTWINSGFNGSPAFIQDPGRFFTGIADDVAGRFLEEIGGGFLCSPFAADIQFTLEIGYYQAGGRSDLSDRYSCSLTDAIGNVEDFLNNDLSQGGLQQFFNVSVRPENNPYQLSIGLEQELQGRIFGELQGERDLLDWNGGFLSRRECLDGEEEPYCTGDVLTPGDTIQNQLNESLGIGRDRLLVADDINEIIGALMNQLVSQVLGGAQGLIGTTSSGGGSSSYFDRNNNPGVTEDSRENLEAQIQSNIRSGTSATRILTRAIQTANEALNLSSSIQNSCPAESGRAQSIAIEASTLRAEAVNTQNAIDSGIRELQQILGILLGSNSRAEYLEASSQYTDLVRLGIAPNEATVAQAGTTEAQLEALVSELQTIQNTCSP